MSERATNRLALAKAFHDGPLCAGDHDFIPESEQGKWCLDVVDFFTERLFAGISASPERIDRLETALSDLVSWFDGGPSGYGPWIIKSGEYGADGAVESARNAIAEDEATS